MHFYIVEINVRKLKYLSNINIKLDGDLKKHLILTGKNGSGKTSLLQGIKESLKLYENDNSVEILNYSKKIEEMRNELKDILSGKINKDEKYEEGLKIKIREMSSELSKFDSEVSVKFNYPDEISKRYKDGDFIFSYFEPIRNSKIDLYEEEFKIKYSIEEKPYKIFGSYLARLREEQIRYENTPHAERIENLFLGFTNILRHLFEDDNLKLQFDYKSKCYAIKQIGKDLVGFSEVSDGYSQVINILMDLIIRMEAKRKNGFDIDGIVLIDEIEIHLHQTLKRKIFPLLINFFPNVQFIVNTNSQAVVDSIRDAVKYEL